MRLILINRLTDLQTTNHHPRIFRDLCVKGVFQTQH